MQKKVKKFDLKNIKSEIEDLKKSLLNLKFQKATGQLEKTSEIKKIRRKIASLTTNIVNNNIGQGPNNTQTLATLCTESIFAAKWCDDLVVGPYNDWFLPNYGEASLVSEGFYAKNLGYLGGNSQNDIWFWLSEEYNLSNPYNYGCSTCPDHAFILRDNGIQQILLRI